MNEQRDDRDAVTEATGYRPHSLWLKGFRGIRDGLRRDELMLDLDDLAGAAQLVAIAGPNGRGKTTVMDNLHPYLVMPSHAGDNGLGDFSYYDHVFLPESQKALVWSFNAARYKSHLVFRVSGRRKTEAYLFQDLGSGWVPVQLDDGTRSDGKVETYERCIANILGSAETFFTSAFSAQGRRQLSAYKNSEIKSLLADLLGLEAVRAEGARAAETARLLKSGLAAVRLEQAAASDRVLQLQRDIAQAGDVDARAIAATQQQADADRTLTQAQEHKAAMASQALACESTTLRRAELQAQRDTAVRTLTDSVASLDKRAQSEDERERALGQRIAERRRQSAQRRVDLLARQVSLTRVVESATRAAWAQHRLPLALKIQSARQAQVERWAARVERARQLNQSAQGLQERIGGIEREAGQAVLRQTDLARRFGLITEVPCAGSDLQGRCKLLADANEARELRPAVDAKLTELARSKAALQEQRASALLELDGLRVAGEAADWAQRQLSATSARANAMALLAARSGELQQAQSGLQSTVDELRSVPEAPVAATEEETAEREGIERARLNIDGERALANQVFDEATARLDSALAALPPAFDARLLEQASQAVDQASRQLAVAEAAVLQRVREQEQVRALSGQLQGARAQAAVVDQRARHVEEALGAWTLFAKCLSNDGVIALDIDDAGPTLAAFANDLLLACYGHRFTVEIRTLVPTASGATREGFDIVVHDAQSTESKSVSFMSGGEKVWINECLVRAIALYLAQGEGRRFGTLFSDESDGALDPERKRMFIDMKRAVLRLGGYHREFFVSQTPELTALADAVIDLDRFVATEERA